MREPLVDSILEFRQRTGEPAPGALVVVGLSGGPDSCALLHALARLAPDLGVAIEALHVHHGLRGAEADADAAFCERFAASLGAVFGVVSVDAAGRATRRRQSVEEAARDLRRDALVRAANRDPCGRVALAHTRDDQAETVLLAVVRSTGIDGLRGMAECDGPVIRPLLSAGRADTEAYCVRHAIAYRTDSSNADPRWQRSRARLATLPLLERLHNPAVRDALVRLSALACEDVRALEAGAAALLEAARCGAGPGAVGLRASTLAEAPVGLARRALRQAVVEVRGGLRDVGFEAIERALQAARAPCASPWSEMLPGAGVRLEAAGGLLVVRPCRAPASARPFTHTLPVPGEVRVPEAGVTVRCIVRSPDASPFASGEYEADVDADSLRGPLVVRSRRPGDRYRPLGAPGARKLQDMLVDRGLPRAERCRLAIMCDAEGIVWAQRCLPAERARVTLRTSRIARIRVEAPGDAAVP